MISYSLRIRFAIFVHELAVYLNGQTAFQDCSTNIKVEPHFMREILALVKVFMLK